MNADCSRRTFLLGGLAAGAVLMAGKNFLQPTFAHAAGEAVSLDAVVNMTPEEMAKNSTYVMAAWKYLQDAAAEIRNASLRAAVQDILNNPAPLLAEGDAKAIETIKAAKGSVNTPSKEFHDYMVEAGKRSWKLFYDTVPNAKEILESAASYRDAK